MWRNPRLIVEVDGYGFHRSPSRFENDRERDVKLTLAGWHVTRFTWAQVTTPPEVGRRGRHGAAWGSDVNRVAAPRVSDPA